MQMRGDRGERGGNARAHRPSSSSWCRHACHRADKKTTHKSFHRLFLWLSRVSLSCHGESQYEEGRAVTGEWISREHLITSVCGERLIRLLKALCLGWKCCLSDWGSHSSAQVRRTVLSGVCLFRTSGFFLATYWLNIVSCLTSRDGVKMVNLAEY